MSVHLFEPKPLNQKAYGSIPHLPTSRLGPGDHHVTPGQARICLETARDRHDRILVSEKLDGSNCAVARIGDDIVPLVRAGYRAASSRFEQHHLFAEWVADHTARFVQVLQDGERLVGEWLLQAHGTRYTLPHEPFVAFDLMVGKTRVPYDAFCERIGTRFVLPRLIHDGGPCALDRVQLALEDRSHHGALDPIEGAVWRVERRGTVDFLAKWVRPDKADGIYLPNVSGKPPVWNVDPSTMSHAPEASLV